MKISRHSLLSFVCLSMLAFVPACEDDDNNSGNAASSPTASSASTAASASNANSATVASAKSTPSSNDTSSANSGVNDPNLIVCIGDSITQGYACDGAPYPSCLASISGRRVLNRGVGGARAQSAPSAARNAIASNPAAVCILYGSNDAINGGDSGAVKEQLRSAIQICKDAGAKVVIGTPPPMTGSHSTFNGGARAMAEAIRALAGEENVPCADLYSAFGSGAGYLVSDGLHPNAAGARLIAQIFNGHL